MSAIIVKNSFDLQRITGQALRNISDRLGLGYLIPLTQDRVAFVAARIDEAMECAVEVIYAGVDTSVVLAANATASYTSTVDGIVILNDFTGAGGQIVNLDGTAVYTVVTGGTVQMRVCVGSVITVVDTADGGTTFKRNVVSRF